MQFPSSGTHALVEWDCGHRCAMRLGDGFIVGFTSG